MDATSALLYATNEYVGFQQKCQASYLSPYVYDFISRKDIFPLSLIMEDLLTR